MSMSDFSQESLAVLSENFQVNVTDLKSLVHLRFNNYMHLVVFHAHQILERDKGINLHSSSGV